MDTVLRQDLIEAAIRYTDAYLGVEKHAKKNGFATPRDIDDFSFYLSKAHDTLTQLGDIDNHYEYMQKHVADMAKLAGHDDSTMADIPSIHLPKSDYGEPAESADVKGDLISEISQKVKSSYLQKAAAQVKELQPHAKKGEYKDIAQNLINKRKRGMAMATEETEQIDEMIRKVGDKYRIYSHTGKNLGTFDTLEAAKKHKREVEYFKHMGEEKQGLAEMDKSAPQPGRDGKVSFSTYGSRDKEGSDYFKGKESPVKPITVKKAQKDALAILKKQGVAEAFSTDPTQPGTWHGHKIIANRKTPKGGFLILQNKNDRKYEIHKHNPGVVGGLEFVSAHKTPEEMQTAFKKVSGVNESKQGVTEGAAIRQSFRSFYENLDEAKSKKKNEEPIEKDEIDSDEIESMVKSLSWEDISDLYEEVEIVVEETIEEKLSPAARMKKQRDFRRTGTRRNLARSIKLHRVSSPEQLKNRAIVAARRLLSKKFLQGRDKASLSPQEKDILEQRLQRLRQLGVQSVLSQRLMPKIRQIERTRLKSKSHK